MADHILDKTVWLPCPIGCGREPTAGGMEVYQTAALSLPHIVHPEFLSVAGKPLSERVPGVSLRRQFVKQPCLARLVIPFTVLEPAGDDFS